MAWSDYGVLIKKNGVYMTEHEIDQFYEEVECSGHGACGTKDFYVEAYKSNLKVMHKDELLFSRYDLLEYKDDKDGYFFTLKGSFGTAEIIYQWHTKHTILCTYIHPITKDMYQMLFGHGVGHDVYDWWKNFLGLDEEELKRDCILEFD